MAAHAQPGFVLRHRLLIGIAGIAVAVILLASFMSRGGTVPVRAAKVERQDIRSAISTNGKVEPVQNFEAHAPIGTTVKRILVKEGDHVKRGQMLLELDDLEALSQVSKSLAQVRASEADLSALKTGGTQEEVLTTQSQLVKAKTQRDTTQRNLTALLDLQKNGAASPGEVKTAQDELARANADVKLLEQKMADRYSKTEIASVQAQNQQAEAGYQAAQDVLSKLNIRAPFDGVVYSLAVQAGNYVNPGDLLLQEADLSKVRVRAFVDEPDVGRLAAGQTMEITWDALPGRTWQGKVESIPSTLKMHGTRNVGETTCIIENPEYKLLPNVNVGVTIITSEDKNVLTIPREALREDDDAPYVFLINNDALQRRTVQTSIANLTQVEITQGLEAGSMVALNSTNSKPLRNGLQVKVIE